MKSWKYLWFDIALYAVFTEFNVLGILFRVMSVGKKDSGILFWYCLLFIISKFVYSSILIVGFFRQTLYCYFQGFLWLKLAKFMPAYFADFCRDWKRDVRHTGEPCYPGVIILINPGLRYIIRQRGTDPRTR